MATSRRALGLGMVQVPELPPLDPATVLMAEPVVPESKRICPGCDEKLRREKGFCPQCGKAYSFIPPLAAGDVVAGQYEILGPMAFGGLGWIFLAKDRVLSRWVVLKGLLNAQDEASALSAVAERQFLAAVKHPNIVGVYNFVQRGTEGYIVMEYVGGRTLRAIRKERGPLPAAEAIAYIHRILGAFAYLHRQEPPLIYCDFKPENFMLEGGDVKLIDMGGVRRADDPAGDIYGTKGYSAPEAGQGPSVESDLFTIARTLAVLIFDFRGFQGRYEFTLPPPVEQPVLEQHPSLHAFLQKATLADPAKRFGSADEMAEQLAGVLREVVASEGGGPRAVESAFFLPDPLGFSAPPLQAGMEPLMVRPIAPTLALQSLPPLKVDPTDPAATFLLNQGTVLDPKRRLEVLRHAVGQFPESLEAPLRLAQAQAELGGWDAADETLTGIAEADDWRAAWVRGMIAFGRERLADAISAFQTVVAELPGESAPKYALALALEAAGDTSAAAEMHDFLVRADSGAIGAAFGRARCGLLQNDATAAARALASISPASSLHLRAQLALARCLILGNTGGTLGRDDLTRAAAVLDALTLEAEMRHRVETEIHSTALRGLLAKSIPAERDTLVLGCPLEEGRLRLAIERSLRALARLSNEPQEKIRLVDLANEVRPPSLF